MAKQIFIHIPKTGGTSLRQLMTLNYNQDEVLSIYGELSEILSGSGVRISKARESVLVQGHIPYGVHRLLNIQEANYFAFLRKPVDQFFSDIQFSVTHSTHGFHHHFIDVADNPELWPIIASEIVYYRNNQTHYMSGVFFSEEVKLFHLNQAIQNLWNCQFVGIYEFFEESLLILSKHLGWEYILGEKLNVSSKKQKLNQPTIDAATSLLEYDNVLYAVALDLFHQKKMKYGSLLDEAADQLKQYRELQNDLEPERQFDRFMVGDNVDLKMYEGKFEITAGSPLDAWRKM